MSDLAKVGAVVIIVVILLFGVTKLVEGDILFRGKTYFVLVRFENGLGLRPGMPLKKTGSDVGQVEKVYPVELSTAEIEEVKTNVAEYTALQKELTSFGWLAARIDQHEQNQQRIAELRALGQGGPELEQLLADQQEYARLEPLVIKYAALQQRMDALPLKTTQLRSDFTEAKIRVNKNIKLRQDAQFVISQEGLIGEKYLSVEGGSPNLPTVAEGHLFYGSTEDDITALIGNASEVVRNVEQLLSPQSLGGALSNITMTLNTSLQNVDALIASAAGLIEGNQGYITASLQNVQAMSEHFLTLSQNLELASVSIRDLAADPKYTETIEGMTQDLSQVSANLNHLSQQLDNLVSDPQVQQDAKDSVRLIKETLTEAKTTLQRFQQTMDKADGVLDGASGLMEDAGGAIGEARGKLEQISSIGSNVDVKLGLNVRAVDRDDNQRLNNEDSYVGDMNVALGYKNAYVQVGAENIGEDNNFNFMLGMGQLSGFSFRGGVYRSELGLGAAYNLEGGGGVEAMLYDTEDPKINALGRIPVGDSVDVVVGVEDIENNPMATVGIGVNLK